MVHQTAVSKRRRKQVMFGSLVLCCLSWSLLAAAFGTEYWFASDSRWSYTGNVSGNVHFGLFGGVNVQKYNTHNLYVVCLDDSCMYSCADTQQNREQQMQMILDGETEDLREHCETDKDALRLLTWRNEEHTQRRTSGGEFMGLNPVAVLARASLGEEVLVLRTAQEKGDDDDDDDRGIPNTVSDYPSTSTPTGPTLTDDLEFMDYGLWVGTIACLSGGLLMAVVGALFAIVNTAITPVEAITGVPGLYLWNGLAGVFDLITVILWALQFHLHLTSNVLLYSASDGWSTQGMEKFGYSYWLVVVAIFVHVANIVIIAIGTWEPKTKDQLQAPESKGGNIMLY